jgi:glycosyltransferase involved in cell wall biosynthesis
VVRLIRDTAARQSIESAARQLVVEKYDWSAVAKDFEAALLRVTNGSRVTERAIA